MLDVEVLGRACSDGFSFDLAALPLAVTVVTGEAGERVALCDGYRRISLEVTKGTLLDGPVRVRFVLDHASGVDRRILTLRRLVMLLETGKIPKSLFPREPRARRWLIALRAFDAMACGASQREIAEELFAPLYRGGRWKTDSEFLRLRVNRLLGLARRMVADEYRLLLR
jgi:hypothetical protein